MRYEKLFAHQEINCNIYRFFKLKAESQSKFLIYLIRYCLLNEGRLFAPFFCLFNLSIRYWELNIVHINI